MQEIQNVLENISEFINNDDNVKKDYTEYLKTIGTKNSIESAIPYIFERNLSEKSVIELFTEKSTKLSKDVKLILAGLLKAQSSIFEVKKVLKNGFELYNLVNEKLYTVNSVFKMNNYRGVGIGQYVVARIFEFEKQYYLLEISGTLPSARKDEAMRFAIAKIVQEPSLVYYDNQDKENEIKVEVKKMHKKFTELFGEEELETTSKFADEVIGIFNDYTETGKKVDFQDKLQKPQEYKYFEIREFSNNYSNFIEKSLGGFSSHKNTYDVGIVFDEETGLYAIPFWTTFNKIFEGENVENADACIKFFLESESITDAILRRAEKKHSNFMEVVNNSIKEELTFDELLEKYKKNFLTGNNYSSTTVLFSSKTFSGTLNLIEEQNEVEQLDFDPKNIGRNDPCPCGSGKKFKNCCMRLVLQ